MVVGETSDSFSMLLQRVSRGSVGSRCASCSETAGLPRQRSRRIARRRLVCFSNTGTKHGQPAARSSSISRRLGGSVQPNAERCRHRSGEPAAMRWM